QDQIALFEKAVAIDPLWREGYTGMAGAYIRLATGLADHDPIAARERVRLAKGALERALAFAPEYDVALYRRGRCRELLGEADGGRRDRARRAAGRRRRPGRLRTGAGAAPAPDARARLCARARPRRRRARHGDRGGEAPRAGRGSPRARRAGRRPRLRRAGPR